MVAEENSPRRDTFSKPLQGASNLCFDTGLAVRTQVCRLRPPVDVFLSLVVFMVDTWPAGAKQHRPWTQQKASRRTVGWRGRASKVESLPLLHVHCLRGTVRLCIPPVKRWPSFSCLTQACWNSNSYVDYGLCLRLLSFDRCLRRIFAFSELALGPTNTLLMSDSSRRWSSIWLPRNHVALLFERRSTLSTQ